MTISKKRTRWWTIAMDVTEEYDWWMGIFARHAARDSDLAEVAECKGIVV